MKNEKIKKKKSINIIIVILFLGGICSCFLLQRNSKILRYDADEHIIYTTNAEEPLMKNIVNPSVLQENKVVGIFMENQPYIGYYDFETKETIIVMQLSELSQMTREQLTAEDVQDIRCISMEPIIFSFIVGDKLYKYDEDAGISVLWEFTGMMSDKAYCWLDDKQILLQDMAEILKDWNFFMLNTETGQKTLIDGNVSAFAVAEEIVYSKKYYMGSWCEWELHFLDKSFQDTREPVRSGFWSVGDIVFGTDGEIYFVSDMVGTMEKEAAVYHFKGGLFPVRKVDDISREDMLIGVY